MTESPTLARAAVLMTRYRVRVCVRMAAILCFILMMGTGIGPLISLTYAAVTTDKSNSALGLSMGLSFALPGLGVTGWRLAFENGGAIELFLVSFDTSIACALAGIGLLVYTRRIVNFVAPRADSRCQDCGHDLKGESRSGPCPECGATAADPTPPRGDAKAS